MIDAKRIGDWGLARPGKRFEFARRESANLTVCRASSERRQQALRLRSGAGAMSPG